MTSDLSWQRKPLLAFTLLELLATVALVAVLVGILVVGLSKMRARTDTTQSVSNARQIALCTLSYVAERGRFPGHSIPPGYENDERLGTLSSDYLLAHLLSMGMEPDVFRSPGLESSEKVREAHQWLYDGRINSHYQLSPFFYEQNPAFLSNSGEALLIYEGLPNNAISGSPPRHTVTGSPVSSTIRVHGNAPQGEKNMVGAMADGSVRSDLYYLGWGNPESTMRENRGVWGFDYYLYNR